mmetsp:Transcript_4492/g.6618  ORF Transcript_4492/g.6618 Transcript_4492/m.6618 type:complete len:91 (+) Transcript_4492:2-274(+)
MCNVPSDRKVWPSAHRQRYGQFQQCFVDNESWRIIADEHRECRVDRSTAPDQARKEHEVSSSEHRIWKLSKKSLCMLCGVCCVPLAVDVV